jgi:hypothetical protein
MADEELYKAAIRINLSEINWARSMWNACLDIWESEHQLYADELLGQSMIALKHDAFSHLMKVLDTKEGCSSYWYIKKADEKKIKKIGEELQLNVGLIDEMSPKLLQVRDKAHFHIDKEGKINPDKDWIADGGIALSEITALIDTLNMLLGELYRQEISERPPFYGYEAQDAKKLLDLAKKAGLIRG